MDVMANPLMLHWESVPLPCPAQGVLRASELASVRSLVRAIDMAQQQLTDLQQAVEQLQHEAEVRQQRWQQQAVARVRAECAALRQEARDAAVAETVHWMQAEMALEQQVARQLLARWRPTLAAGLHALLGQQDQVNWLLQQLDQQMPALLAQGRLLLSVSPEQVDQIRCALAGEPLLRVAADVSLQPGQAVLDNGLVRVTLDVPAQLTWLLQQLAGCDEEGRHAG